MGLAGAFPPRGAAAKRCGRCHANFAVGQRQTAPSPRPVQAQQQRQASGAACRPQGQPLVAVRNSRAMKARCMVFAQHRPCSGWRRRFSRHRFTVPIAIHAANAAQQFGQAGQVGWGGMSSRKWYSVATLVAANNAHEAVEREVVHATATGCIRRLRCGNRRHGRRPGT